MATIANYRREDIRKDNPIFSPIRTTIESAFYGNNVIKVSSLSEAYKLAKASSGTVVTDMPVHRPTELGLDEDSKILLFNDGEITGRFAGARVIIGENNVDEGQFAAISREAVFNTRYKKLYHAQVVIGLHEDFMVKAHLLIPEGYENTMYSWMLNFQYITEEYIKMYKDSTQLPEGDIYILSDPEYYPPTHSNGLALFDPQHNCALLCGMRYFGEHKKGTLTLAWGIANRNGFASCHGGMKRYNFSDNEKYTIGVFGLSGSGKSTLTHEKHDGKYDITILHDDAYVISTEDGYSVALEPSYFDKTQDYPTDHPANKYLVTVQNCGVTLDDEGNKVIVTEDLRNGNGRAVKSKLWAENRIDKIDEPVDSIAWLMKDATIPPVIKINNPILASVMGATLATKRSTAERLASGVDMNALVIEPYANPFRTYPLEDDYNKFKELFNNRNVECYIFNTGHFLDKKIPKEVTLKLLEDIATKKAEFKKLGNFTDIEYVEVEGFTPDMDNAEYQKMWLSSLNYRKEFLNNMETFKGGRDKLPQETLDVLEKLEKEISK
ncbi:phosphoenolpyruvate carboxykinase (ATP) [Tissierella sp. MB52-C2]|uniref:phosphoenolpyruvate carboxykinase (ATP) n=1 Tax=Tissierella sp. MB52-C2 TaxID=3070999 RepID=UPI00280ACEA8|nr:phosphoenolpyruvate carboxykinase (ATP) [Tissierella sp. MB52-C2]WMM26018.1 phosphoenolpyruvate carboxykinase (ATP) [Tissierella sp. MB52-C2]